jgi:hypothetical protein
MVGTKDSETTITIIIIIIKRDKDKVNFLLSNYINNLLEININGDCQPASPPATRTHTYTHIHTHTHTQRGVTDLGLWVP